jgi:hypothetical protein
MSDIFREIDEELRRDNLLKLWSRFGRYIIAGVIVVLLIVGGVVAWRDHLTSERRALSVRYSAALALAHEGKNAEAARMFAAIGQEGGGFALLAAFEDAALTAKSGDAKAAAAAYDKIAALPGIDLEFQQLAVLLSAMQGLDSDPQATITRLEPLTASGKPWRASALELTAAARLKLGDKTAALEIYKKLADDLAAPEGVRARAAEMAAALAS